MIPGMGILALPSIVITFIGLLTAALLLWGKGFSDKIQRMRSLWVGIVVLLLPIISLIAEIVKNLPT